MSVGRERGGTGAETGEGDPLDEGGAGAARWRDRVPGGPGPQILFPTPSPVILVRSWFGALTAVRSGGIVAVEIG